MVEIPQLHPALVATGIVRQDVEAGFVDGVFPAGMDTADFKFLHFLAPCRLLPLPRHEEVLQCPDEVYSRAGS